MTEVATITAIATTTTAAPGDHFGQLKIHGWLSPENATRKPSSASSADTLVATGSTSDSQALLLKSSSSTLNYHTISPAANAAVPDDCALSTASTLDDPKFTAGWERELRALQEAGRWDEEAQTVLPTGNGLRGKAQTAVHGRPLNLAPAYDTKQKQGWIFPLTRRNTGPAYAVYAICMLFIILYAPRVQHKTAT